MSPPCRFNVLLKWFNIALCVSSLHGHLSALIPTCQEGETLRHPSTNNPQNEGSILALLKTQLVVCLQ
jgi:hypothetical protein